tara:strand:- start:3051 stop:3242 length:192 start_codon:yes stop_codon:yes gene_type:complete
MIKYTKENYFVDGKIPQDVLCRLQARKDELFAEVCEIEALICEHKASVLNYNLKIIKEKMSKE